ncbi:nuclear transport factor 2 family protein [Streptomyces roseoverticillatus]|uniref:nuclear transport factor 2 family protein n=1 Tax=Streptomyces roseoverticillatus TaxID=66429 RepID=UPI0033EC0F6C
MTLTAPEFAPEAVSEFAPEAVSETARETAALRARIDALTDRAAVTDLIDRYLLSLDARRFDDAWARGLFTPDVRITSPVGKHEGIGGLAAWQAATLAKFERTQHIGTNYVLDIAGDRATVRWNALMTHVHLASTREARGSGPGDHFTVGGTFAGEVVRTPGGWRFRCLDISVVWTHGEGPLVLTPEAEEALRSL